MTAKDTVSIFALVMGVILAALVGVLIRRGRLKLETLPLLLGIGGVLSTFLIQMGFSIVNAPKTYLIDELRANILWSLAIGIVAYLSGRAMVNRWRGRS